MDGGLCERSLIRAVKLHSSEKLIYEQLALVETLAIGCHATDRGNPREGQQVLVVGAGPIGLSTLEFTRLTGATITVMDMVEERLEFCKSTYGIENLVQFKGDGSEIEQMKAITDDNMYEIVTDATGNNHSMAGAMEYVAHTGTLVYVGITTKKHRGGFFGKYTEKVEGDQLGQAGKTRMIEIPVSDFVPLDKSLSPSSVGTELTDIWVVSPRESAELEIHKVEFVAREVGQ